MIEIVIVGVNVETPVELVSGADGDDAILVIDGVQFACVGGPDNRAGRLAILAVLLSRGLKEVMTDPDWPEPESHRPWPTPTRTDP